MCNNSNNRRHNNNNNNSNISNITQVLSVTKKTLKQYVTLLKLIINNLKLNNMSKQIMYFAFGSNLSEKQMAERMPSFKKIANAKLKGYELSFPRACKSERWDYKGIASIREKEGAEVQGVVYELTELGIHIMDWYEETDKGIYERITVNVETEQGEMEVITYRCIEEEAHYIQPCEKYINQIIDSAKYHGLPVEYLESLEIFRE